MIIALGKARGLWLSATTLGMVLAATIASRADGQDETDTKIARLLESATRGMRHADEAAQELMRIGKPAVPALIKALEHQKAEIRWHAARVLGTLGPIDERFLPALIAAMERADNLDEGNWISMALAGMGPAAVKPAVEALGHRNPIARATAAATLGQLAEGWHKTSDQDVRPDRKPIPLPPEAIAPLIAQLDDSDAWVRSTALMVLARLDPNSPHVVALIPVIIRRVGDPDVSTYMSAVEAVTRFGPKAKAAVGPLADRFQKEPRNGVRRLIAEALGALGAEAAPAVPMLLELAQSADAENREDAIYALGLIGPNAEGVLPALRTAMGDSNDNVRSRASEALGKINGPEIPTLIEALKSPNANVRKTAADALQVMGTAAAPAVPALITRLEDDHEGVVSRVVRALGKIGDPAVPSLIEALGHDDPRIRLGAAEVLGLIGPPAVPAVDRLETLRSEDPDPEVRRYAALALAAFRPSDPENIAALAEALRDEHKDANNRLHSAAQTIANGLGRSRKRESITALIEVLARLDRAGEVQPQPIPRDLQDNMLGIMLVERALEEAGPEALPILIEALGRHEVHGGLMQPFQKIGAPAVPALINALRSDDATRRAGAARALWTMARAHEAHEHTIPAVPALTEALKDQDPLVRANAAMALGQISPEAGNATGLLIQQLSDPNERAADSAGRALSETKADPAAGVPALIALFSKPEPEIHQRAMEALAKVGHPAIPALLELLKKGDRPARQGAAEALREMVMKMGYEASVYHESLEELAGKLAIPLAEALKDEDPWVRHCAGFTLSCLNKQTAPALPTLITLLDHKTTATRVEAIGILGKLGAPAVPALMRAIEDADPVIRAAAATALGGDSLSALPGTDVVEPLLRALKDNDPRVRAASAASLHLVAAVLFGRGDLQSFLLEELFPGLYLPSDKLGALKVVTNIAFQASVGRPMLQMFRVLSGETATSRWEAPFLAGLTTALTDPDPVVRQNAAKSLGMMRSRAMRAFEPLLARLGDQDEKVRSAAVEALGYVGPAAVPRLTKLLASDNAHIRAAATEALGRMIPKAAIRPALDALVVALKDPNVEVRAQAVQSLAGTSYHDPEAFQPCAPRMIDPLLENLKHPNVKARRAAARALSWTGPKVTRDDEILPPLIAALDDPDAEVRKHAAEALQAFEDRAIRAIPALRKACKDTDYDVRHMAGNAIEVITH